LTRCLNVAEKGKARVAPVARQAHRVL